MSQKETGEGLRPLLFDSNPLCLSDPILGRGLLPIGDYCAAALALHQESKLFEVGNAEAKESMRCVEL